MCKPDWDFWKSKEKVEAEIKLWQAVCLSFDIDPDSQRKMYQRFGKSHYGLRNKEVDKRLELLRDSLHLRQFFSSPTFLTRDSNFQTVILSEFAAWCLYMEYDIPKELEALAKKPDTDKVANDKNAKESGVKTPMRYDETRAFLQERIGEGLTNNAAIWLHILTNSGKPGYLFECASNSTATTVNGKTVLKKDLSRQFLSLLKKIKERENL